MAGDIFTNIYITGGTVINMKSMMKICWMIFITYPEIKTDKYTNKATYQASAWNWSPALKLRWL